jgi:hypothetical protein
LSDDVQCRNASFKGAHDLPPAPTGLSSGVPLPCSRFDATGLPGTRGHDIVTFMLPSPGELAMFTCVACERFIRIKYHPGGHYNCPGCGRGVQLPFLPPWHPDYSAE